MWLEPITICLYQQTHHEAKTPKTITLLIKIRNNTLLIKKRRITEATKANK